MRYAFKKLDAFARNGSAGNPAGAVYLEPGQKIDSETMQRIAYELRGFVSEVGFVFPLEPGAEDPESPVFRLRYYSAEREVDFCGHATIAIMYDFFASGNLQAETSILIETNRGKLEVYNRIAESDAVFISAPYPEFSENIISRQETAKALGVEVAALDAGLPVSIVNAGLNTLLVPLGSLTSILGLNPDFTILKKWCLECGADIVEVFCHETVSTGSSWRVRVFCPRMGYLEDPATGSGNSAFGYYLLRNALWKGDPMILEQNNDKDLFNSIRLSTLDSGKRVLFGGGAQVKIDGSYLL